MIHFLEKAFGCQRSVVKRTLEKEPNLLIRQPPEGNGPRTEAVIIEWFNEQGRKAIDKPGWPSCITELINTRKESFKAG
jgi:hypothetical protein